MFKKAFVAITFLLITFLLISTIYAQTSPNVIRNGNFENGLNEWVLNPLLTATDSWPVVTVGDNKKIDLHPDNPSNFKGVIIYQNLDVTGIAGKTFGISMKLTNAYSISTGKTVAVYLIYVDNQGNLQRQKVINPENNTITGDTPIQAQYTFPNGAQRLVKIEIVKEENGRFYVDDVALTADGVTVNPVPVVTSLSQASGNYGSQITINGTNFGQIQGSVFIGGSSSGVNIASWSDTSIVITVQDPVTSGRVLVEKNNKVQSNIDNFFNVTSPNYTLASIGDIEKTVIKGEKTVFVVRIDFNNGFTTQNEILFTTDNQAINGNGVSRFAPVPLKSPGGVVLMIDTTGLAPGTYKGNIQANLSGYGTRSAPFTLNVITVAEIKFFESVYNQQTQSYTNTQITQKNINKQGAISGIYASALDGDGKVINNAPISYSSSNPTIIGVYPTGFMDTYYFYALENGTGNIVAQTPDGQTASLPVNVSIPDSPRVNQLSINPNPITNKYTDPINFLAVGTHPIGYGYSSSMIYMEIIDDTRDWSSDKTQVAGTFKVNQSKSDLGSYLFSAYTCSYEGNYCMHTADYAIPFTIINDPTYSAIKGRTFSIDPNLMYYQSEHATIELYQGATKVMSKEVMTMHSEGKFGFGGITPGTYKIRVVPPTGSDAFKPQWYPNAEDPANAKEVTFTAGQTVEDIFFFLKAKPQEVKYNISGRVTRFTGTTQTGVQNVTLMIEGGTSATTDANGNYTFTGLSNGTYTVTPSATGNYFIPSSRTVTINNGNVTNVNFVSTNYTIEGQVKDLSKNEGIQGVTVYVKNPGDNTVVNQSTTSANGMFKVPVPSEGEYILSATKEGYDDYFQMDPPYTIDQNTPMIQNVAIGMFPAAVPPSDAVSLVKGWNFISFPKDPPQGNMATALSTTQAKVRVIWGFDNGTKQWLKWRPSDNTSTLTSLASKKGYWIYMNESGTIDMSSWTAPANTTVQLFEDWNLIGYQGTDGTDVTTALNPISGKWTIVWGWDAGIWSAKHISQDLRPTIPLLEKFYQKKAYWIKLNKGENVNWTQP
ncbi:MAG: carboxypeptidase regulatory-like domain-containing protein [Syntrophorhabdaceae bacterium]|nr:carboxypeptidase regulatory-like domain-containing protein [Syntrophorhabdaceae bacterium]